MRGERREIENQSPALCITWTVSGAHVAECVDANSSKLKFVFHVDRHKPSDDQWAQRYFQQMRAPGLLYCSLFLKKWNFIYSDEKIWKNQENPEELLLLLFLMSLKMKKIGSSVCLGHR